MPRTHASTSGKSNTQSFRPGMELLETRETPAIVTAADTYTMFSGTTITTQNLAPQATSSTTVSPSRGVLGNDYNNSLSSTPQYASGLTAKLISGPVDDATGAAITTPFQFNNNGPGSFRFTAPENFEGQVSFTYQAIDDRGDASAPTRARFIIHRATHRIAVGADAGGSPRVSVYNATGNNLLFSFQAYDTSFTGGVRVAVGDFNGDGVDDIVTVPGAGGAPNVRIFDGRTGVLLQSFYGLDPNFTGGLNIATGDINGDGVSDILFGADQGGGPRVTVLDGSTFTTIASFFAYNQSFTGGVRVAAGDVTGNGIMSILTAPGFGGAPNVRQFDYNTGNGSVSLSSSFFAGDPTDTNGLYITSGDYNGDGVDEIAVGSGAGTPVLRVYNAFDYSLIATKNFGPTQQLPTSTDPTSSLTTSTKLVGLTTGLSSTPTGLASTVATPPGKAQGYSGGLRVGTTTGRTSTYADLIVAGGPGTNSEMYVLAGSKNNSTLFQTTVADKLVFGGTFYGGLFVAGS